MRYLVALLLVFAGCARFSVVPDNDAGASPEPFPVDGGPHPRLDDGAVASDQFNPPPTPHDGAATIDCLWRRTSATSGCNSNVINGDCTAEFPPCKNQVCACNIGTSANGQPCTATCPTGSTCDLGGSNCKVKCPQGAHCVVSGTCTCEGPGCSVCMSD